MDVVVRPALITDLEILHGIMEKEDWNSDIIILRNDLRCHPDGMLVAEDKQSGKILGKWFIMSNMSGKVSLGSGLGYKAVLK